jgi:diguanylate cyclase (GGDEF)-like protein
MPSSPSPSPEVQRRAASGNGRPPVDPSLRRRFVEAARRAEIVGLVNAATSEADLGRRFTDELCEVFDAELAFVVDEGGERREPRAVGAVGGTAEDFVGLLERPECAEAIRSGDAVTLAGPDVLGVGASTAVIAPFRTDDGRVALVGVARLHEPAFDETDRALVEAVTVAVGQGLERIWVYEARNRAAKEQAALVRAAKSMSRSLETREVLNTLCAEAEQALDCDTIAALLGDEVDGYEAMGTAGLPESFLGFRQPPGSGLGGRAVQEGRTLVTHRYQEEGYAPPETGVLDAVRSSVAVPLRWDGRARGFIAMGYTTPRRITTSDVELLEGFAELGGLACANAERHAEVREAAEVDGLTGCLNRDALQSRLGELLAEADRSGEPLSLALLDLDGFKSINDIFGHPSGDSVLKSVGAALRSSVRTGDLVARYGGDEFALILPDSSEERARPVLDRVRAAIRSMDVPGGKLTACVGLAERAETEPAGELLSRADEALREAKGSLSPGSIRRAPRAIGAGTRVSTDRGSDRRHRWRAIAGDIALGVARETDPEASAEAACNELQEVLQLDHCCVLRLASGGRLEVIAETGPSSPSAATRAADDGTVGRALREKRTILGSEGAGRRDSDLRGRERSSTRAPAAEVAVPLIIGGRAWGALACIAGRHQLDEVDAELVAAVAEHLSASVRTADLYEQLTDSMIGTAEALAAALEAKDSYTADHARSIAELAVEVGRALDLPESAIEDLRYGGIFHDVGKIAVPDALINKPGPLTDEEWEVIKQHPAMGAEILAPVPFLYGVRTIVRHAHEHWDGGGYPDGLKGAQIPLGARIVLAVDAYHAMTSDRPYRRAMSHEEACAELTQNAGSQFDPEVVEALLWVLERRDRPATPPDGAAAA